MVRRRGRRLFLLLLLPREGEEEEEEEGLNVSRRHAVRDSIRVRVLI